MKNRHYVSFYSKDPLTENKIILIGIDAISRYRIAWARRERVDIHVLGDWEHEVSRVS